MQDYKLFIAEINRLEVKTKQLFVKDGQVLDEEYNNPKWYVDQGHPEERWPGYLSTFYDFDKYNADGDVNLYESQLAELREFALVDLLCLPGEQLNRFLTNLRGKRDRMSRLNKIAMELHKEYLRQQFENSLSLKYNLFEAFKLPQPLGVSLEPTSARYLMQAVTAKRNELYTMVKQIERAINPEAVDGEGLSTESDLTERRALPILHIKPESRQALYNELKKYVTPDLDGNYQALHSLVFNNLAPDDRIVITSQVRTFGLTFHKVNAVPAQGAKVLSEQLPKYFERNDGKNIVRFTSSNLVKLLRGEKDETISNNP